jgi:hypothetical protein
MLSALDQLLLVVLLVSFLDEFSSPPMGELALGGGSVLTMQ